MNYRILLLLSFLVNAMGFSQHASPKKTPFLWPSANLYFVVTDRFCNGDTTNDVNFGRTKPAAKFRGFEGGDIKGVTKKIKEGYFDRLGVNALWLTPIVEQIHDGTDEGTGLSYGFHGYWTRDWSALDPNFGTEADLQELVTTAHAHGIRIVLDAVINHTGPVTHSDPEWPSDWVRTGPTCSYKSYETTTACTLVANLPDVLTESDTPVELPPFLLEKWKNEGRYEQQTAELDAFFKATGYPRAPKYYIIKWLTDYVRKFGIDGYRADTVKHTNPEVWMALKTQCDAAFAEWKKAHPESVLDDNPFFMVAEVYGYGVSGGRNYDFGDHKVDYFDHGFDAMINFEFRWDADKDYAFLFGKYAEKFATTLKDVTVLNYTASHDDGNPFDAKRVKSFENANKLLLCPGISQTYYGDETARLLVVDDATGDAKLRSPMNWDAIEKDASTQAILEHWQKIGRFRGRHVAVGAGTHTVLSTTPYVCARQYAQHGISDAVVIGLDLAKGAKTIAVTGVFKEGQKLRDAYSGQETKVKKGAVTIDSPFTVVLLEEVH
ncbi:alpha-amylase family glycosyl hydrolase [Flavobacterium sp. HJ-32-4]|uniref:alpha-amylase family glycosyl hydrolase n=1 Tax=Flavobacterium sp. HJ-32-4 TaxID=1160795 RepID=UPI001F131E59|nr:alpha-amylase family glycosyl hydrolase [Flavobacterium sp. HJ-32-4]UMY65962.1 alpha-amylase family glycosyl hydrolase [Flavobacterium sp. HJ-32-4]